MAVMVKKALSKSIICWGDKMTHSRNVDGTCPENIWEIGLGHRSDASSEFKFGVNTAVGNASVETIWSEGGLYANPAAASVIKLSSDSATDTGDATVRITGLDANYAPLTETKAITGQTAVTTTGVFLRVFRLEMTAAASGQTTNVGILYAGTGAISTGKPAVVLCLAEIGEGQSLTTNYSVKAGATALITGINWGTVTAQNVTLSLKARELGSVFRTEWQMVFNASSGTMIFAVPIMVPAKTDFELRGIAGAASANVSASMSIVLLDN